MAMAMRSDYNLMEQIQATHTPYGLEIKVKPILQVVMNLSVHVEDGGDPSDGSHEAVAETMRMLQPPNIIDLIHIEALQQVLGGVVDGYHATFSVLNLLSSYSWDAKVVLTLAAFATNVYAISWIFVQSQSNGLANSITKLRPLPNQSTLNRLNNFMKALVDLTKCIVEFNELSHTNDTQDVPALSAAMADIPITVYWIIRGIVYCTAQIASLVPNKYATMNIASAMEIPWEQLTSIGRKIHRHLNDQLATCYKCIDEEKQKKAYQTLVRLFDKVQVDNMRVLKALIYADDDLQPLFDGANKKRVNIEVLRRKYVLLLISNLDIPNEELAILEQIYIESRHHPTTAESRYEVVWVPIHDHSIPWTDSMQKQFEHLKATMPWYTVHHPSLIERAVINFTKEVWHFGKKPILVVLDPQGRVACPNALHMMWVWGSMAFPFTTLREESLWTEETWSLELLVNGIDPLILNWISEGRYICLYGGEDIEWIRKFTTTAGGVAQAAGISLGMVYVGKSNPKERVRRNIAIISGEKLSHYWEDLTLIWYFWVRIESMWHSKIQLGKAVEDDPVMQEIITMMSFNGSEGGWALFSRGRGSAGASEIIKAKGSIFLNCLSQYGMWKENVQPRGFMTALKDHLLQLHTPHHCNRIVFPGTAGGILDRMVCSECGRPMERFNVYQCCDE